VPYRWGHKTAFGGCEHTQTHRLTCNNGETIKFAGEKVFHFEISMAKSNGQNVNENAFKMKFSVTQALHCCAVWTAFPVSVSVFPPFLSLSLLPGKTNGIFGAAPKRK